MVGGGGGVVGKGGGGGRRGEEGGGREWYDASLAGYKSVAIIVELETI